MVLSADILRALNGGISGSLAITGWLDWLVCGVDDVNDDDACSGGGDDDNGVAINGWRVNGTAAAIEAAEVRWGLLLVLLPVCSAESLDFFRNGGISGICIGWRAFNAKELAEALYSLFYKLKTKEK